MKIIFTEHARVKFKILKQHGFDINEKQIRNTVEKPHIKSKGRKGRFIAQRSIDDNHVIRVVYDVESDEVRVITFYPARRERYEN